MKMLKKKVLKNVERMKIIMMKNSRMLIMCK